MGISEYIEKYRETTEFETIIDVIKQNHYNIDSSFIYDECSFDGMVEDVEGINPEADIKYDSGATKVVVIFNEIVLKKTFTGYIDYDEETDEEIFVDYVMNDQFSYNYSPDYCAIEAMVFEEAVAKGLSDFFVEVIKVTDNIYAQLRVNYKLTFCDNLSLLGLTWHDIEEIRESYNFDSRIPDFAIGWWFIHKESRHLQDFANFLDDHRINDLHSSNIGIFNGQVKIFDYSGYNSGTEDTFQSVVGGRTT